MVLHIAIIGSGPGGYVAAIRAAQRGARVTVVEEAEIGGTCLNKGCIPTKTLIASAELLEQVRNAGEYGIDVSGQVGFNLAGIRKRKDKVVSTQVRGIKGLFKSWGIELVQGRASLTSPTTVRVARNDGTTSDIVCDRVIIATGSQPARLPGFPFDGDTVVTSDDAIQLKRMPGRLLIVGAGVIGCEFAFIYRTFGAEVTVVELMPRSLMTEDPEIASVIEREMKKAKIKLILNAAVKEVVRASDTTVTARLSTGQEITIDQILLSIGRTLNSEDLGLERVGITRGKRGEIVVNERMETEVPGIYAIGDVTGKILLAHVASRQGLVAVDNALGGDSIMDYSVVPSGIFTMPEVGSVGIREHQAAERNIKFRTGRFQYRQLGKAHAMGTITGMVKIIADAETDKVLGVHIVGAHATDLVHEGALAIRAGLTAEELAEMIHAHPTLAEAVMEAAEDVHQKAIHAPKR